MTLLNSFSPDRLVQWLTDFYLLATVLLLIAMASRQSIGSRPPADGGLDRGRRTGGAGRGLRLPIWPKVPLLAAAPARSGRPAVRKS